MGGGTPTRSRWGRGVPQPGPDRGYPGQVQTGGTPSQGWGTPHPEVGFPPARSDGGDTLSGIPPPPPGRDNWSENNVNSISHTHFKFLEVHETKHHSGLVQLKSGRGGGQET